MYHFFCRFPTLFWQVYYNPSEVSFEVLCGVFFGRINPTQVNGQGGDRGTQYRTGIYPHTKEQSDVVRCVSVSALVVTGLLVLKPFLSWATWSLVDFASRKSIPHHAAAT